MLQGYELFEEVPDPEVFCQLRLDAGMTPRSLAAAAAGLPRTLFGVLVRYEETVVGMGRVVGDGGLCFQVSDIAVHPDHQFRGLGKAIMARLVEWLHACAAGFVREPAGGRRGAQVVCPVWLSSDGAGIDRHGPGDWVEPVLAKPVR